MAQKMSKKKKASAAVAGVLAAVIAVGGAYAWVDYSQSARNTFKIGVSADVLLHDDFDGQNKDVYVENTGESDVYVRVKFAEYLQIGNASVLAAYGENAAAVDYERADAKDVTTWPVHQFMVANSEENTTCNGNAASSHSYYEWKLTGAQKDYLSGVTEADSNGRGGLTQEEFDTLDYGVDFNLGTITTHKNRTEAAAPVMMLSEYLGLSTTEQNALLGCWLLDTDGWAYWSKALAPDTATNLLLDEVVLNEDNVPYDNWEYNIDVQLQAASVNELDNWYANGTQVEVASPDNSIATTTLNGYNFVNLKAGNYIVDTDGLITAPSGTLYVSLGGNVYREAQASGEGYVGVVGTEVIAGQDQIIGTDDDNMLSGRSAQWGGEIEIELSSLDLEALTYTFVGAKDGIYVDAGTDKILGTYDDVIREDNGLLGKYDITATGSQDNVGWLYLGGGIEEMLVTTEYVLNNTVFNPSSATERSQYADSTLEATMTTIYNTMSTNAGSGIGGVIVTQTELAMGDEQHTGNYVHVCTSHDRTDPHTSGCTTGASEYYTDRTGQANIANVNFFALSLKEMIDAYGDGTATAINKYRAAKAAPLYVAATHGAGGGGLNYNNSTSWDDGDGNDITTTHYWLRSPGYSASRAASVGSGGGLYATTATTYAHGGARPACYLNLSSN